MRTAPFTTLSCPCNARVRVALLFVALGAPSLAAAQAADAPASSPGQTELEQVEVEAPAAKSGFGQVMSVLTGLLHDAAMREAGNGGEGIQLEDPALRIEVTPVAGSDSFLQAQPRKPARTAGEARATVAAQLAGKGAAQATPR